MGIAFFGIFAIFSVIHLYASYKLDKKLRAFSKVFLVSSLLGWYLLSAENVLIIFALALFFSWLGDVLLIPSGIKWFALGGISFGVSHLCFVLTYGRNVNFAALPLWAAALIGTAYAAAVFLVFRGLRPHLPKQLFIPMAVYLMINGAMNCFAFFQLLSMPCAATVITFAGAVLFFCSDAFLFFTRFKKDSVFKSHFWVMLTYLIAELLITLGTMLL